MNSFIANRLTLQGRRVRSAVAPLLHAALMLSVVMLFQGVVTGSALADATGSLGTVTTGAASVLSTINAVLRPLSLIAIIVCGLAAGLGRMEWGNVIKVGIGVLIANSATTILDFMSSGTTAT